MSGEKPGESFSVPAPERRSLPRYTVDENSVLLITSHGAALPGKIENLSLSGCRLRARQHISATARSRIEISFKVNGAAFRFNGILAWTSSGNIAGIRFVDMIPRRKAELAEILGEMEATSGARADDGSLAVARHETLPANFHDASERTPEQHRMQPVNHATEPTAPGNRAAAGPRIAPAPSPSDRRTCARHTVDTSAVILLINVGSILRGRILDLSLSGCRIRTDDRFPVGIFTRVETEFHLQGLPFRLGGVIQTIHDRNTVGIRFLDLSDRKRQQVAELIGEIQQIHAERAAAEAVQE